MEPLLLVDRLGEDWATMLQDEIKKDYFRKIPIYLKKERQRYTIYPESQDVFNAFRLTPYKDVKVVIAGQDPYIKPGEAHGLAFSVKDPLVSTPPSLKNIFQEIENDLNILNIDWNTNLTSWAEQGVFLLNSILTVRKGESGSHRKKIGWERFTSEAIKMLNISPVPIVFMLWGGYARQFDKLIDNTHHCVLKTGHPSPMSANRGYWFGNKHFSKCNEFLETNNFKPINWKTIL